MIKQQQAPLYQPLASRMRPQCLEEYIGQRHLVAEGKPLRQMLALKQLYSMIFWGPPGTGKTTLANLLALQINARFEAISAVFSGVKDIRAAIERAKQARSEKTNTVLFVDEVHRFNKAQQDAFLPYVEDGTIILIGATTENPSFELNNALLSRARVYILKSLTINELQEIINATLRDQRAGYQDLSVDFPENLQQQLAMAADGDARRLLNLLEITIELSATDNGNVVVTQAILAEVLQGSVRRFDKQGDDFYDQISALHKSIRGSSPDAALYWLARMLDGGCDPHYLCRRIVRIACEDIGNADPRALQLALQAWETFDRLGSPEGELAMAQAVTFLACAAKSNAVYKAFGQAQQDVKRYGSLPVPAHLRNAPTSYRYAHDEPQRYAAGERYFPKDMADKQYYQPASQGLEIKIAEKLAKLKQLDRKACKQTS